MCPTGVVAAGVLHVFVGHSGLAHERAVLDATPRDALVAAPADAEPLRDETLELLFLCCHPALSPPSQMALTLREVCGLTTTEIASACSWSRKRRWVSASHAPSIGCGKPPEPSPVLGVDERGAAGAGRGMLCDRIDAEGQAGAGFNSAWSLFRPRRMRPLTVPGGSPSFLAISVCVSWP